MAAVGRSLLVLAAVLAVLQVSGVCWADETEEEEEEEAGSCTNAVSNLTDENFQEEIKNAEMMLVMFYTPWCHHCHSFLPTFTEVACKLRQHNIQLAKLDIENAKETKNRYEISEVPALKVFMKGLIYPYEGPTDVQGIIDHLLELKGKAEDIAEDPVINLTEENFDNIITSSEIILVDFYADWCVHCQRLEPHFVAAARTLRTNDPPILFGKVKVPDQIDVAKRFGIGGYPLLLIFRYGKQYNYTGPRDEEGIVEYMRRQAGPSSTPLASVAEVRGFINSRETRVVGFFSGDTSSHLLDEFKESGNLVREDVQLGHTTDRQVAKGMGFPEDSAVVFYPNYLVSKYEPGHSVISSLTANATALSELYLAHARPLVGQMTKQNFDRVYRHRPMLVAYYEIDWEENIKTTQYWHDLIASVAKDFQDSGLIFAIADEEEYANDLKALGLADWGEDVAVGLFAPGPLKYNMKEELTPESLREFVREFLKGKLVPHRSSEPPPRQSKGTLIKTIVGSTFEKIVLDPKKNVMVKLCVPDLPDCVQANEYYPKVAERYIGDKDIIFGEMNVAVNDPPTGTKFDTLPAFFFSKKDSTEMIPVDPKPTDDSDLVFFLKWRHQIKPTRSDRDIEREKEWKKSQKEKKKKASKKSKKEEDKKPKDEL